MHECVSKLTIIGWDGGLSPDRNQSIFWISAGIFMMTSSNGNIFRVTGHLCGEFTGPGEFPTQRPVTRSFDVYFDLRPNKWLSKQSWGWWFETLSCSLWRHRNVLIGHSLRDKLQWNLKRNTYMFIQENAFENVVWKMAAILFLPQCANQRALLTN